ncbi:MAG: hypothetical protein M0Z99_04160 [Betaproteobacteria bacterium]|nr:hypothetical protein [Betaproteobacteria bacterium]
MDAADYSSIPNRAETLQVLRLMGGNVPMLMLSGAADGFGARWSIDRNPVQPAIARWLMQLGYVADTGATELGVRILALTAAGVEFRRRGLLWWAGLGRFARLKIVIFG